MYCRRSPALQYLLHHPPESGGYPVHSKLGESSWCLEGCVCLRGLFHSFISFISTCQYPLHKSRVAMYLAFPIFSNKSSMHIHSNSSFLKITTGMHHSEWEGSITPIFNIFSTSCCNFSHQLLWNPVRMMPDGSSILLTKLLVIQTFGRAGIHGAVPAGHTSSFVFLEPRAG